MSALKVIPSIQLLWCFHKSLFTATAFMLPYLSQVIMCTHFYEYVKNATNNMLITIWKVVERWKKSALVFPSHTKYHKGSWLSSISKNKEEQQRTFCENSTKSFFVLICLLTASIESGRERFRMCSWVDDASWEYFRNEENFAWSSLFKEIVAKENSLDVDKIAI